MKKLLLALTISLFSLAFSKNWGFSLTPFTGLTAGKLGEYLYSQYDKNFMVSDLQWQEVLWNIGVTAEYNYKNFFVSGTFSYYMPFTCGKMTDSDYNSEYKTNYCIFENYNPSSVEFELDFKYKFNFERFSIFPCIKEIFSFRFFEARNGYGWLGDNEEKQWNDPSLVKHSMSGINFQRDSFYTFLGVNFEYIVKRFNINAGIYFSPFTFSETKDYHKDESNSGNDFTYYAFSPSFFSRFTLNLKVEFSLTDKLDLVFTYNLLIGPITKGSHFTNEGHSSIIGNPSDYFHESAQKRGVDIYENAIKFGVKIKL